MNIYKESAKITILQFVAFKGITAMVVKGSVFWHITACKPLKYCLLSVSCRVFKWLTFEPLRWRPNIPRKVGLLSTNYTALYSQELEPFILPFVCKTL
jgi:hypothetical protein